MNYFEDLMIQNTNLEFVIPYHMGLQKFLVFSIAGFNPPSPTPAHEIMLDACEIFNSILLTLNKLYSEEFAFARPDLIFKPDSNEWAMKIGMMRKELFEKMKEPALNP